MSILKELKEKLSREDVIDLYEKHQKVKVIADMYNTSTQTISRLMDFYGIKRNRVNAGNKKHFFNEDYFENIDTQEKAYWLGFIYADGCVYKGTGNSLRFQMNLKADDLPHINKFQEAMGSDYDVILKDVDGHPSALLQVNSTKMCKHLVNHGVVLRKSLVCKMPNLKEDLIRHFIRGYFDGDGSVCFSASNRITKEVSICGGKDMMSSISKILGTKLYLNWRKNLSKTSTSDKQKILDIYEYFYNNATIYLQRKKRIYDILVYVLRSPLMR